MLHPRVSIIIPTYNVGRYLRQAIASVVAQTYADYEIIVIDDGSTDDTAAIVQALTVPIRYFYQVNGGISAARNAGLSHVEGEFVAFLDADDIWLPTKLHDQLVYLDSHPEIEMIFSLAQNTLDPLQEASAYPILRAHIPPNCVFRRHIVARVGLFDETIRLGEFADWYGRAIDMGVRVYCLPKLLVRRRLHGENIGIKQQHNQLEYVRVLKRKLDRANGRQNT